MNVVSSSVRAFGSTSLVAVTDPAALRQGRRMLVGGLRQLDLACSRFRRDSELVALNDANGECAQTSALLRFLITVAVRVAEQTDGLVDPTIGRSLRLAGYDRSLVRLELRDGRLVRPAFDPAGRWREIVVDDASGTVRLPRGVELDLGATGKAAAADRIAHDAAAATGCGVLVSIGGDIAVAGSGPAGGWVIGIADDHTMSPKRTGTRVSIASGGIASSGTRVRRWLTSVGELHHILDPRTGAPARETWSVVSVAASSCLDANAASTAAVVLGPDAPGWLGARAVPARLERPDGHVVAVAGWPEERAA